MEKSNSSSERDAQAIPKLKKAYSTLSRKHQLKREKILYRVLDQIKMTSTDAFHILSKSVAKNDNKTDSERMETEIDMNQLLCSSLAPCMDVKDVAALTLYYQLSDREINFIRRYVGGIPKLDLIRTERWKFFKTMPMIFGFNSQTKDWDIIGNERITLLGR